MATFASDDQDRLVCTVTDGTEAYTDPSDLITANQVQANNAINALHSSFFDHWLSTTNSLFGRLEDKFHVASEFCPPFTQNIGYGKCNTCMPIMSTGVHLAIYC